jgi:hypothetical protein
MNINIISAYAAAQEAVSGFRTLLAETLKTFIFTGNCLNKAVMPILLPFRMSKVAGAHMIAAAVAGYENEGFR